MGHSDVAVMEGNEESRQRSERKKWESERNLTLCASIFIANLCASVYELVGTRNTIYKDGRVFKTNSGRTGGRTQDVQPPTQMVVWSVVDLRPVELAQVKG